MPSFVLLNQNTTIKKNIMTPENVMISATINATDQSVNFSMNAPGAFISDTQSGPNSAAPSANKGQVLTSNSITTQQI